MRQFPEIIDYPLFIDLPAELVSHEPCNQGQEGSLILSTCSRHSVYDISETEVSNPVVKQVQLNRVIFLFYIRLGKCTDNVGCKFETILKAKDFLSHPKDSFQGVSLLILFLLIQALSSYDA